ncbi:MULTISPECIES: hypothetical protein [Pseudomonadota]|uniref:hypothetical protein n=1 Tax=Pseudomonadota TaxID=1224 RepID=UPI00366FC4E7
MARRSTNQAPAADESNLIPAPPAAPPEAEEGGATAATVVAGAVSESATAETTPIPDISPPDSDASGVPPAGDGGDAEPAERVKALVLHDSIYGKCGEVREFAADQVDALRRAGYIDPHPNAVALAGS